MKRVLGLGLMLGLTLAVSSGNAAPSKDTAAAKEALKELQEFIGGWKGAGQTKPRPGPRDPFWTEEVHWGWKFKGDDAWLTVDFKGGKFIKTGEIRYVPKTKKYQLTGTTT